MLLPCVVISHPSFAELPYSRHCHLDLNETFNNLNIVSDNHPLQKRRLHSEVISSIFYEISISVQTERIVGNVFEISSCYMFFCILLSKAFKLMNIAKNSSVGLLKKFWVYSVCELWENI